MKSSRNYRKPLNSKWLKNCGICFILIGLMFFAFYLANIERTEAERDYLKEKITVTGNAVSGNGDNDTDKKKESSESKKKDNKGKNKDKWDKASDIIAEEEEEYIIDLSEIQEENSDFYGWLYIPETNIDYPVMFTPEDEEYYLRRDFDKNYSFSGTLFCNKNTKPKKDHGNMVIYGHNMRTGTMFQNLTKYGDNEFFNSHNKFWFSVYNDKKEITETTSYEVIAVVYTDVNEGCFKYWQVSTEEEAFNEYTTFLREHSIYNTEGLKSLKYGDKIITLSTCVYHTRNGRLLVVGKRECL